jgi:hypothetical protein
MDCFLGWEAGMLRYLYKCFALALTCLFGACSIHPLPKDVTGYSTPTLVRKIRCEARDAIKKAALEILHKDHRHGDVTDIDTLRPKDRRSLTPWEIASLTDLSEIGIVYNFTLDGVESGGLTFNADIIKPIKNGSELFSPSLSDTLKRDNTRTFTISDTFNSLVNLERRHCEFPSPDPNSGPSYQYPIAGRIGLDEMIQSFVRMSVSGDLVTDQADSAKTTGTSTDPTNAATAGSPDAAADSAPKTAAPAKTTPAAPAAAPAAGSAKTPADALTPAGSPTMVDSLVFTTTISAGLTPKITLSPVGTALQLEDASLAGTVMRMDTHTVNIALALQKPSNTPTAAALATSLDPRTAALFITHQSKSKGSGEKLAAQALVQELIRRDLLRRGASIAIGTP